MRHFKISETENQFKQLAEQVGGKVEDGVLFMPDDVGQGFLKSSVLVDGLIFQEADYNLFEDFYLERKVTEEAARSFFSLIYNFQAADLTDSPNQHNSHNLHNQVLFFNGHYSYNSFIPAYTLFKQIHFFISFDKLMALCKYYDLPEEIIRFLDTDEQWCFKNPFSTEIQRVLHQLRSYQADNLFTKGYRINKAEELIMLTLEQILRDISNKKNDTNFIHEDDLQTIIEVEKILLESQDESIKIIDIANQLSIGIRKLQRLFKAYHGTDMTSYRKQVRMEQARQMIMQQNLSITEVCYKTGYTSVSHFSKIFKDHFGTSPSGLLKKTS
ncbi:helix-turn-helix transcriptional regulator [Carboxylicivirga mesophila]|uniref:Helix-turn-helix transcriptional regulator n=1 Tax=Carboxylicivirga mesophila TaxID=1166478 RepID=A0ABS5KCC0_9BACT|nr:AraC family transcriptional regulator [Carboxylicivirga mesophila]MBS2212482.1 helix-turn-helix transcriptional regulator [Carboxylicivirga mesophila]